MIALRSLEALVLVVMSIIELVIIALLTSLDPDRGAHSNF